MRAEMGPFIFFLTDLDLLIALAVAILILLGIAEGVRLSRFRSRIAIRIHVNGIRGKSSVVRLIAAGLRQGGIRTIAKTTGTYPRLILEDGREVLLKRRGKGSIGENIKVVFLAGKRKAQALVLECNAIHPEYQRVLEHRIFRSTHGVITNVRRDHTDIFGDSLEDIARFLGHTIPQGGILFTAEKKYRPLFIAEATSRNTKVEGTDPEEVNLRGEKYPLALFPENVSLALKVCESLGVERDAAIKGMGDSEPDPGAFRTSDFVFGNKNVKFINAFSVNDPESTGQILGALGLQFDVAPVSVLLNNRPDRILRAIEFARFLSARRDISRVFITGSYGWMTRQEALRYGMNPQIISVLRDLKPGEILERIAQSIAEDSFTLIGMGNFAGMGEKIISLIQEYTKNDR